MHRTSADSLPGPDTERSHSHHPSLPEVDLVEIGLGLVLNAPVLPTNLIPLRSSESIESLRHLFPDGPLCACDFVVDGAHGWARVTGGFAHPEEDILNIDHHSPHPDMFRFISSGNLAAEYVRQNGPTAARIINNHTDCDSIISRLIMGGEIPPLAVFEQAVIAADHTGEALPIADLLQALDVERSFESSVTNLGLLLSHQPLEPRARQLVDERARAREATAAFVDAGNVEIRGTLAVLSFDGKMRNEFLPALLPGIAVFLTVEPGDTADTQIFRLRLGGGAPSGFTLNDLDLKSFDPRFGGRWNAGANKRGGGSKLSVGEYADFLHQQLNLKA